ncbi:PqqD family protein [Guyparkeria sp. SCN-R1]|uniref:PqqD family protein n=1 Tax=Guyparkeria sp. SCN-R1 TaxID=2341113 RepID=UPI0013157878|nr:PqqD family protein [Guyparkeria sp. SCN-R1]
MTAGGITTEARDLVLPGIGPAVRVSGCPEFSAVLKAALAGWSITEVAADGPVPTIRLEGRNGECRQVSPAFPGGVSHRSPVSAACAVAADLVERFLELNPQWIGLHCASVEVNGRLVLFPETHRAGKSTLMAALAGGGQRVFGDDVLALGEDGQGMALGIAPRLRLPLPLPPALDVALHQYTTTHAGPEDDRYRYLDLPDGQLAHHGETLPLGAVVLLERDESLDKAELLRLAPGEGLTRLLRQHFAHDLPSEALMARFLPLMQSLPCRLLRYPEPLAATRRLLASMPGVIDGMDAGPSAPRNAPVAQPARTMVDADDRWQATEAVREYELDEERFLIHVASGAIYRLNATGQLVWGLLRAETISGREIALLLSDMHPMVSASQIRVDVQALLTDLVDADLVVPE